MATYNGTVTKNSSYYSCYIVVDESNVSTDNNSSTVSVAYHIKRKNWGWIAGTSYSGKIIIDGTTYSFKYKPNWAAGSSGDVVIATASKTVYHDSDGEKDCEVSATWTTSGTYSCGTASANGILTLTKIARFASITSAPNFTDEDNPKIGYSNPAGNSVDSLQACIAEPSGNRNVIVAYRDISKTGSEYTFNLTDAERTALRNYCNTSASKEIAFYIKTIINEDESRPQANRTLTIINANPAFSNFEVEDSNDSTYALTGNRQKFIKKYSNVKATISTANKMTTLKQATPIKYLLVNGDKTPVSVDYSATASVSGVVNNIDTALFSVSAVDSRNLQTTITKTLDMIDYTDPVIQTFNIHRVDGAGTNIVLSLSGTYSNVNFGAITNTIKSMKIRNKKTSESTYSEWATITTLLSFNEGKFSVDNATITNLEFEIGSDYDVQLMVSDELSEYVQQGTIDDGTVLMAALKGYGMAFGGVYKKNLGGALQVYGEIYKDDEPLFKQKLLSSELNMYMIEGQYVTLLEPISKQRNGIVLVWSEYKDGEALDYNYNSFFISKKEIETFPR